MTSRTSGPLCSRGSARGRPCEAPGLKLEFLDDKECLPPRKVPAHSARDQELGGQHFAKQEGKLPRDWADRWFLGLSCGSRAEQSKGDRQATWPWTGKRKDHLTHTGKAREHCPSSSCPGKAAKHSSAFSVCVAWESIRGWTWALTWLCPWAVGTLF